LILRNYVGLIINMYGNNQYSEDPNKGGINQTYNMQGATTFGQLGAPTFKQPEASTFGQPPQ
jgi:hypothetical protein